MTTRMPPPGDDVILEHIADAVTAQDATGRLVYANDAARRMFGIIPDDLLDGGDPGRLAAQLELCDADGQPLPLEAMPARRVLRGEPEAGALIRWRRRDVADPAAEERWTEVRARPVRDDRGQVQLAINLIRDVTAERRAERRLALLTEAGARLTASLDLETTLGEVARLPLPRLGDWSVVHLVGEAAVRRVGAHADGQLQPLVDQLLAPPRRLGDSSGLPPTLRDGRPELLTALSPAHLRERFGADTDPALLATLGTDAGAMMTAALLVRGRVIGAISVVAASAACRRLGADALTLLEDLAERAALAVDNARVYQAAQAASDLRRDLLAVVAHDLKNPLNAISMGAALLARGAAPDNERQRRHAGIISRAAERMNRLIHDLLDVNAIDAGRMDLEVGPVSVGGLIHEALEAMAPLAQEKAIVLERELSAEDEVLQVRADRERLLQVFSNLIGNAVRHVPERGHIRVRARRLGDQQLQLAVIDDGPGIEPEHLPHVFDRYWRVRKATRDGTGLGLSIVKGIVEAHGGTVSVDTAPGRGATFAFTVPIAGPPLPNVYKPPTGA
jgi:signal transduction histidine kinase